MRVRQFELRLLAGALTILWALGGGLVLFAYRPGGPLDLLVGVTALAPFAISAAALLWPPVARSPRAFAAIVWLGLLAAIILTPAIGGVVTQILARGPQTLLPSPEAIYPWILALGATSLFSGLGIARRVLGETSLRRRRLGLGLAIALASTLTCGGLFAGAAVANEIALRDRPSVASRFGPTDPDLAPPACDEPIRAGLQARLELNLSGEVDLRPIGNARLRGSRSGTDVRWSADVATTKALGTFGAARVGPGAWVLEPNRPWTLRPPAELDSALVDIPVLEVALSPGNRVAAEDRGLEFVEGALGRHCRIGIDGPTVRVAIPEIRWLVGDETLHRWRGQLDYWIFGDGQLGQVAGSVGGEAGQIAPDRIGATVRIMLTATDRDVPIRVSRP